MEERVKRLEMWNRGLIVALILFFAMWAMLGGLNKSNILVGKQVTTEGIVVMDQIGPKQKPRVQLLPATTDTIVSFIGSNNKELLSIGIERDPKQSEIPMIMFQTKAGRQILAPNEEGKMTWKEEPSHQSDN